MSEVDRTREGEVLETQAAPIVVGLPQSRARHLGDPRLRHPEDFGEDLLDDRSIREPLKLNSAVEFAEQ